MNNKKLTLQPDKVRMREFLDNELAADNVDETLDENIRCHDKFIQEPDDEEEHLVKPFEAESKTSDSCAPIKAEIVSAIS